MNFTYIFVALVVALVVNGLMVLYYHTRIARSDKQFTELQRQAKLAKQAVQYQTQMLQQHAKFINQQQVKLSENFGSELANYVESSELSANMEEVRRELAERDRTLAELKDALLDSEDLNRMQRDLSILYHADMDINNRIANLKTEVHTGDERVRREVPALKREIRTVRTQLEEACKLVQDQTAELQALLASKLAVGEKWLKRDFNASGDGTTDDADALEAFLKHLLATGDVGRIEIGSYKLGRAVTLLGEGRSLMVRGVSCGASRIVGASVTFKECRNALIESVTIESAAIVTCKDFRIINASRMHELELNFSNDIALNNITLNRLNVKNVQVARLENSTIYEMHVVESQTVLLRSIDARAVTYDNSHNCTHENSHIMEGGMFTVKECKMITFSNLFFVGNGFDVIKCEYVTIANVTFVVSSRECIYMQQCEFGRIQQCTVHDAECALYLQECFNFNIGNVIVYNQKLPAKVMFQVNKCSSIDAKELSVISSEHFDPMTTVLDVVDSDTSTFAFSRIVNAQTLSVRYNCESVLVVKPANEPASLDDYRLDVTGDTNDVVTTVTMSNLYKGELLDRVDGRKLSRGLRLIPGDAEDTDQAPDPNAPIVYEPLYKRRIAPVNAA